MFHLRISTTAEWLLLPILASALLAQLFQQTGPARAESEASPTTAAGLMDQTLYLPLISVPEEPEQSYSNVIVNGSFEEGWETVAHGNQQPNGWTLSWLEPGELLYDDTTPANAVPEIVHKLVHQLPPDEQPGGPNALILDGDATYKLFHDNQTFGAELRQTVTALLPGTVATLTVPVQLHWREQDDDVFAAEAGVWVNGQGQWANMTVLQDRQWYTVTLPFVVPADGVAEVVIRFKSKWAIGKDFFIDDVRLMAVTP
jgi:hypothetical protein